MFQISKPAQTVNLCKIFTTRQASSTNQWLERIWSEDSLASEIMN